LLSRELWPEARRTSSCSCCTGITGRAYREPFGSQLRGSRYGCSFVAAYSARGSSVPRIHRDLRHEVRQQFVEYGEAVLDPAARSGQIHDDGLSSDTDESAAQRGHRRRLQALRAQRLGNAWQLAIEDRGGRLRGLVG